MNLSLEFFRNIQLRKYKAWNFKNESETFEYSAEGFCLHIYLPGKKITKDDRFPIVAWFYNNESPDQKIVDRIKIHSGDPENWETIALRMIKLNSKAQRLLSEAKNIFQKSEPPSFYRNPHCPECPLQIDCIKKLKEKDCISLLGGISEKSLIKYHKKGIFTILQLSHLFRPRRRGRELHRAGHYLWELKALAIREQKTFVLQSPEINNSPISIFLDFEGLPDENFIYLIGIVIQEKDQQRHFSFWADTKDDEGKIFFQLIETLDQYPDAPIYHYGSYEGSELKKLFRLYSEDWKEKLETIQKRMINLLGFLRAHVYPPIYTNGLKDLGQFLRYEWADPTASGLKSIAWRKEWELTAMHNLKEKLINYNLDDCKVLIKVHQWLFRLSEGNEDNVQQVSEMKRQSPYNFKKNVAFAKDYQVINNAAYFDYQRSKIYFRNNRNRIKPAKSEKHLGRGNVVWQPKKINEVIEIRPLEKCPHCGCRKLYHSKAKRTFRQTDLKFTAKGMKQWIIEYRSGKGRCAKCVMNYYDSSLRMLHYGQNLFAWAMNLYVNYHISNAKIAQLLKEQFGIYTNKLYFTDRKKRWIPQFKEEVDYLWKIVKNSPVIHIDETTVRLSKGSGYVWAFATTHTVFYHITLKRESDFLNEWLKDYDGIIVTDFFSGY
ncbi:MAG TPA: TM0106 family RecB-like putative nuclease, partial [Puia sp.]|nr:TM0106 family RecB-like putative nuclease [Puia sp.]